MLDGGQRIRHLKLDVDALGNGLLTSEEDSVLGGPGQVRDAELGSFGPGCVEQFGENAIDLYRFLLGVVDHLARDAGFWQVAAYDVEHASDARQRIADFVRESCGELA